MKKWSVVLAVAIVAARLTLPEIIKRKANQSLSQLPEYTGHVEGVSLGLWRGAVALENLKIKHKKGDFALTIKELDMDVSWGRLLKKKVVADVHVISPRVRILVPKPAKAVKEVKEKTKAVGEVVEKKTGKSLPDLLGALLPFNVREFRLSDGTIRIQQAGKDLDAQAEQDKDTDENSAEGRAKEDAQEARLTELEVVVHNLTNDARLAGTSTASGKATAKIMNGGKLTLDLKLNPLAERPAFDLNMALTRVNLVELNPLFRWQWDIDLTRGHFAMYMEAAAREGGFKGYVKPFFHDLKFTEGARDDDKKLGAKVKEAVVEMVTGVLKNEDNENVASRVPFEGRFEGPEVGIWEAIITVLRNAFVRALAPRLESSIS